MSLFKELFPRERVVIGMIHVWRQELPDQILGALEDLWKLQLLVDGVIVENYGWGYKDANLARDEMLEKFTQITSAVVKKAKVPVGVNILPNDYEKAFEICRRTGARFVQLDHVTGYFKGCLPVDPGHLMQVRSVHPEVALLGGVHPKYYERESFDKDLAESAIIAKRLADGVVVTGDYTGDPARLEDLKMVRKAIGNHPLVIGSGLDPGNVKAQFMIADGGIVGTAFKKRGVRQGEPISSGRVIRFMERVEEIRKMT